MKDAEVLTCGGGPHGLHLKGRVSQRSLCCPFPFTQRAPFQATDLKILVIIEANGIRYIEKWKTWERHISEIDPDELELRTLCGE